MVAESCVLELECANDKETKAQVGRPSLESHGQAARWLKPGDFA